MRKSVKTKQIEYLIENDKPLLEKQNNQSLNTIKFI